MRAVVQRVKNTRLCVDGELISEIPFGLTVFLGVKVEDKQENADYLAKKIANLRIFEDENGKMNRSLLDVNGAMLIVSQFTLYGDTVHGRRPGFDAAAKPDLAIPLYEQFIEEVKAFGVNVDTGIFGAEMLVALENDGPVTFTLEK